MCFLFVYQDEAIPQIHISWQWEAVFGERADVSNQPVWKVSETSRARCATRWRKIDGCAVDYGRREPPRCS